MEGYMTTKEAAEKWGITQRQVQNHCKKQRIPGIVTVGTNYLIPENTSRPVYGFHCEAARAIENRNSEKDADEPSI